LAETLKIIIPMAGWGTRMRPHTYSKPKPLVSVANKTSLEHLMDMFASVPNPSNTEYIFSVGPYLGETQIPEFFRQHYPNVKAKFVVQHEMNGQSHAIWMGHEYAQGPALVAFADTLIKADFSFLHNVNEAIAWVKPIPDPRRFGVAELDKNGQVIRLIEKPQTMENNLALVGCYYFPKSEHLMQAIDDQMNKNILTKNEYFLADAINLLLDSGLKMRTQEVDTWLDTGTIEATLETNRYFLENQPEISYQHLEANNTISKPVIIHPSATIINSVIGPFASIGLNCKIINSRIENSILEEGVQITNASIKNSLIGKYAEVQGYSTDIPLKVNMGDHGSLTIASS